MSDTPSQQTAIDGSDSKTAPESALHLFAAAVAHEIRTPLSVISGEIEVALRRERPAAEYREALCRIATSVSELLEMSGDLTLFSEPVAAATDATHSAQLGAILLRVHERYMERGDIWIDTGATNGLRIAGDEQLLARAITLVVEQAIRHRQGNSPVSLHMGEASSGLVRLVVSAQTPGFWPGAWKSLTEASARGVVPLRLRTARRILEAHGGALQVGCASGMDVVHIELVPST
jgi:two-component system OmpR family sensor kinase